MRRTAQHLPRRSAKRLAADLEHSIVSFCSSSVICTFSNKHSSQHFNHSAVQMIRFLFCSYSKINTIKFTGIPVLFIPGNAGSHKQGLLPPFHICTMQTFFCEAACSVFETFLMSSVRSLGSVALRKAQDSKSPFHFDYFSLDLNEASVSINGRLSSPDRGAVWCNGSIRLGVEA